MPPGYPLRTQPWFRDYLWGGRKLQTRLGKQLPRDGVWAESWEIIDHPEHQSRVVNGPLAGQTLADISRSDPAWILGKTLQQGSEDAESQPQSLPLLLKYLDCQKVLSVQVHPDDAYASRMSPPDRGKTEAWYFISVDPGAVIYAGLRSGVTAPDLRAAIAEGTVESCLHAIHPTAGDCIFIPAGTVHALGAGLLVAEIQQASNTTFRLFDWNRTDADGNARPLHIDQAMEVIDFSSGPRSLQQPVPTLDRGRQRLIECDKFTLDRISGGVSVEMGGDGRFHLLTTPTGSVDLHSPTAQFESETLAIGQSVLIPAATETVRAVLADDAVLLDMYL